MAPLRKTSTVDLHLIADTNLQEDAMQDIRAPREVGRDLGVVVMAVGEMHVLGRRKEEAHIDVHIAVLLDHR